jgi:flagella basal body P-ring formation protein FlgA
LTAPLLAAALLFTLSTAHLPGPVAMVATAGRAVVVDGDRITLGDISPTLPRDLLAVDLGPAPSPGAKVQVTRAAVADALRRHGADPSLATGVPVRQDVRRAAARLEVEELEAEVRTAAMTELPLGVDIDSVLGLRAVTLPPGDRRISVTLGRLRRSTRATIEISVGERRWASISATLQLSGVARTPVLRKTMAPGATIAEGNVTLRDVEIDDLPEGAITRTDQLVGRRLKTRQNSNAPLRNTATEATPIVARGATVNITASRPGFRITRQAIAQQDGAAGDNIRVKPIDDTRVMVVRIDEDGEGHVVSSGGVR